MNKEELKQYIDDNIYENQDGEITGESLNAVLKAIVDDGGTEVKANPTGEPTETLEKLKIGETIYTAPQGPQGEPGEDGQDGQPGAPGPANTLIIGTVTDGEQASASITGEAPNQQLNLVLPKGEQGDPGQNAVNPFKGWFTTENIPTTGQEGDYCNVSDTSVTPHIVTIYRWNTAQNAFVDTGEVPDTADGETFASSETLQQVAIDNSMLVNPVNTADPNKPVLAKAEDVMQLKAKLEGVTASETKVTPIEDWYPEGSSSGYYNTSKVWTTNSPFVSTRISVNGYKKVRFIGYNKSFPNKYAYGFLDADSQPIGNFIEYYNAAIQTIGKCELEVEVPADAEYFVCLRQAWSTYSDYQMFQSSDFYCYLQSGDTVKEYVDNKFIESKDYVDDIVQGEVTEVIETINPTQEDEIVVSLDASNFISSTYVSSTYRTFKINIERESSIARSIRIVARENAGTYYFIARNEVPLATGQNQSSQISGSNMASNYTAECNVPASGSLYRAVVPLNTEVTIELTPDAKWLYVQKNFSYTTPPPTLQTPELIELTSQIREGGLEDEIEDLRNEIQNSNSGIFELHLKNSTTLLTSPISLSKGFFLSVTEDYRVGNAILVNGDGETLDAYFRYEANRTNYNNDLYRFISNVNCIADCYVIYEIFKADGGEITNTDGVIENFCYIDDISLPILPDNISATIYQTFLKKLQTSIGFKWEPIGKVPYSFGDRTYRYLAGKTYIGVNYSGPEEFGTTVGIHVSMLTFFTALQNPRSVVYTEKITTAGGMTATSAYGYVYATANSEAGCFYGCVCTGLTSYLMGLKRIVSSSYWGGLYGTWFANTFDVVFEGEVPEGGNEATITDSENHTYHYGNELDEKTLVAKLQPMDFIWNQGHCLVISSIYKDKYGEVKYIVLSEQTTPTSVSTAYTPEFFFKRYKNYIESNKAWKVLRRKTDWTLDDVAIPRIGMDAEYCIMDGSQYVPNNMPVIDPDITTFAGEYAAFAIGDYTDNENNHKLYLNIHRGGASGYTNLQIFNEEDDVLSATPLADIAIDVNGGNVAQSSILDNDTADDWIVYNLMNYWNTNLQTTTGKFKARVVRKEGGTITQESGCTHFAMVYIHDLEIEPIVGVNDKVYFNFNVKGGTPINLSDETSYGFLGEMPWYDLTEDDYIINPSGEYEGHFQSKKFSVGYMRLYVKTDYGVVNKRIKIV